MKRLPPVLGRAQTGDKSKTSPNRNDRKCIRRFPQYRYGFAAYRRKNFLIQHITAPFQNIPFIIPMYARKINLFILSCLRTFVCVTMMCDKKEK